VCTLTDEFICCYSTSEGEGSSLFLVRASTTFLEAPHDAFLLDDQFPAICHPDKYPCPQLTQGRPACVTGLSGLYDPSRGRWHDLTTGWRACVSLLQDHPPSPSLFKPWPSCLSWTFALAAHCACVGCQRPHSLGQRQTWVERGACQADKRCMYVSVNGDRAARWLIILFRPCTSAACVSDRRICSARLTRFRSCTIPVKQWFPRIAL
jgi:hypothetical protein